MMYNRYIPQPDGSYRRSRMDEPPRRQPQPAPPRPPEPPEEPPKEPPVTCAAKAPVCDPAPPAPQKNPEPQPHHQSAGRFLRQLLPKDFDTGDLIVVFLLLLIAGDCAEERNNALLTLALYFIL